MRIYIQVINATIKNNLRQLLRRRVLKLETYGTNIIAADVTLKKDSADKEIGYHAEIRLSIKGYDLFGKAKGGNFEEALNIVVESLRKRLRKKKTGRLLARRSQKVVF